MHILPSLCIKHCSGLFETIKQIRKEKPQNSVMQHQQECGYIHNCILLSFINMQTNALCDKVLAKFQKYIVGKYPDMDIHCVSPCV